MKTGFALLAGLLVTQGIAGASLTLNSGSCGIQKTVEKDIFSCPCQGGSGDYDYHYTDLPEGWQADKDKVFPGKGKWEDRKVYGTKVQVIDRKSKQSVKKSLFFSFQNGKLSRIADHDFDFDVKGLVSSSKDIQFKNISVDVNSQNEKVRKVFQGAKGVGGGCGLTRLRSFVGGNGLYKGDDKNPYKNKLPTDEETNKVINGGKIGDIKDLVVNTVRGKAGCRQIGGYLQKTFKKLRDNMCHWKDDVDGSKKHVGQIQKQIQFLNGQLKESQQKQVDIRTYLGQLQELKKNSDAAQQQKLKLNQGLKQATQQIQLLQSEISKNVLVVKKAKDQQNQRNSKVSLIDDQIAKLQARIRELGQQKQTIRAAYQGANVDAAKKTIEQNNVKIEAIKIAANQIRTKIKAVNDNIQVIRSKIGQVDKITKSRDNNSRGDEIKNKISDLHKNHQDLKERLSKLEPVYKDFNQNYDDIVKIRESNFNGCYKTIFNDDKDQFNEDNDDGVEFSGKSEYNKYIQKVFGKKQENVSKDKQAKDANIRTDAKNQNVKADQVKNQPIKPADKPADKPTEVKAERQQKIRVKRTHIMSPQWVKAHGSPFDDNFDQSRGHRFVENDFDCDINSLVNLNAFSGKIISINKNTVKVSDNKGEECTLYLGGCTRIQSVNKPLPQAGDEIQWKGTQKGSRSNQHNVHHVTCS